MGYDYFSHNPDVDQDQQTQDQPGSSRHNEARVAVAHVSI